MSDLLHDLIARAADRAPASLALSAPAARMDYGMLHGLVDDVARALAGAGLARDERVAVWLDKRLETVAAMFGAARAGGVFVPVNPVLKEAQVLHIMRDCDVTHLVTTGERFARLAPHLGDGDALRRCVLVEGDPTAAGTPPAVTVQTWDAFLAGARGTPHRRIDVDLAAILYTSGSTGRPKGVVLTHRNMVAGAKSVADYLGNVPRDRLLALLPLSFDAGFSQLSTAFHAGASVHLMNYLLPAEVPRVVATEGITGLGAVPPVWIPLARLEWPEAATAGLRYVTNTGGAMPRATLELLRAKLPATRVFLMYGLTEAFRSTYLPPEQLDRRPDSIGKAIPNAEILVVRADGTECDPDEPGELVHRGALVAQGYWNDPAKTAERFRRAPGQPEGVVSPELAVWSGDTVRRDAEGFLYFVGRRDEMIKTSGYRVSPTEVEEALYAIPMVAEVAVFGAPHPELGQQVVAFVVPASPAGFDAGALIAECRRALPGFMVPGRVEVRGELPRNPNGKINRTVLRDELLAQVSAGGGPVDARRVADAGAAAEGGAG